jgi:peptidoglycan/LPS O-acetylase OafA/YrhL
MVLAWHYVINPTQVRIETPLAYALAVGRLCWSGVDLFFVLSGFLIGGILLDARRSPRYFSTFYIRRFWRIVPIYAVVCALFFLCLATWRSERRPAVFGWLFEGALPWHAFLSFTQNFWMAARGDFPGNWMGITWSLAIEEQFYLVLPLLVRRVGERSLPWVLIAIAGAAVAARTLLCAAYPTGPFAAYVLMPCRADALMLGVLGAVAVRRPGARAALLRWKVALQGGLLVGALGMAVFTVKNWTIGTVPMTTLGYTWLAIFYLLILLWAVLHPEGWLGRILRLRWLMGLGSVAYGTYLLHQCLNGLCHGLLRRQSPQVAHPADAATTLLALLLTLTLAHLSWTYFEKPLVRRGQLHRY